MVTEDDVRAVCARMREAVDSIEELLIGSVGRERYWRNRAEQAEEALNDTNGAPDPDERPEPLTLERIWAHGPRADMTLRDGSPYHLSGADENDWRL